MKVHKWAIGGLAVHLCGWNNHEQRKNGFCCRIDWRKVNCKFCLKKKPKRGKE